MDILTKKLHSGFEMPVFGFGTWQMGGRKERDFDNDDEADITAIKAAIDLGVTHIDTAEIYADGYSEQLLARALKGYDRSKLFIVSKVQADNMAYHDVIASCKGSLQRLEMPYLDLYLLHRYNPQFDLKKTMGALDELVSQGFVRNIGVANFTKERLAEAQSYTKNKIVCDQVHYNLEFREPERNELVQYCQKNDVFLVAWRPVGKGNLLEEVPPIMQEMCNKYNKTPAQVAINWLISQDNVLTLSKTRNIEHLQENLGAIGWEMEKEDIEKIRNEYPGQKELSDVVPLG
ncbi:MAG: aldo/keto reductase [bacterium]|nr:aldo/keto reductase [bacterium]